MKFSLRLGTAAFIGLMISSSAFARSKIEIECIKGKTAACVQACQAKSSLGCYELGNRSLKEKKTEEAKKYFVQACDLGLGLACLGRATIAESEKNIPEIKDFLTKACDRDSLASCNFLIANARTSGDEKEVKRLQGVLSEHAAKGCREGSASACVVLGERETADGKPATGKGHLQTGCAKNVARGCLVLGTLARDSGNLKEAGTLFKKACSLGEFKACNAIAAIEMKIGNGKAAREFFELSCSHGEPESCNVLGAAQKLDGHLDEAIKLFERSCKSGAPEGCNSLARVYYEKGEQGRARNMFNDLCRNRKIASSCQIFGLLEEKAGKSAEARDIYKFACDAHQWDTCLLQASVERKLGNVPEANRLQSDSCLHGVKEACKHP